MMTLKQLWADYERTAIVHGYETPHEIALQKYGFFCGAITAAGMLASGIDLDLDADALLSEADRDLKLEADWRAADRIRINASRN